MGDRASAPTRCPTGSRNSQALAWHKSFGMTILMLAVVRLVWRSMNPTPDLAAETKPWERVLAKLSHVLLYALIFAMPLTGWMMSSAQKFSGELVQAVPVPRPGRARRADLSTSCTTCITRCSRRWWCVALLHIAGALKHHFIDKNDVLKRMLPFGGVK